MTENRLISTAEAAKLLGEDARTVQRKAKDGVYPATKLPGLRGSYVFERSEIEAIADESAPAATSGAA